MTLFDLPEPPKVRRTDPETSRAAARRAAPMRASWRARILDAHYDAHGLTDNELCETLGVDWKVAPTIKTARSALTGAGELVWTGLIRDGQRVWAPRVPGRPMSDVRVRGGVL